MICATTCTWPTQHLTVQLTELLIRRWDASGPFIPALERVRWGGSSDTCCRYESSTRAVSVCSECSWKKRPSTMDSLSQRPPLGINENIATSTNVLTTGNQLHQECSAAGNREQKYKGLKQSWKSRGRSSVADTVALFHGVLTTLRFPPSHYSTEAASVSRYHMVQVGCFSLRRDIKMLSRRKKQRTNKKGWGRWSHGDLCRLLRKVPTSCSLMIVIISHWPEFNHMGTSSCKGGMAV